MCCRSKAVTACFGPGTPEAGPRGKVAGGLARFSCASYESKRFGPLMASPRAFASHGRVVAVPKELGPALSPRIVAWVLHTRRSKLIEPPCVTRARPRQGMTDRPPRRRTPSRSPKPTSFSRIQAARALRPHPADLRAVPPSRPSAQSSRPPTSNASRAPHRGRCGRVSSSRMAARQEGLRDRRGPSRARAARGSERRPRAN